LDHTPPRPAEIFFEIGLAMAVAVGLGLTIELIV
jgi:hypothetical protein